MDEVPVRAIACRLMALHPASPPSASPAAPVVCASCGAALAGPFCHLCGEKRLDRHDYALGHFLEHTLDAFTHFDFKVLHSIWSLLRRPGQMTADVLAGRRQPWAKPLQVFLIVNLLYYVVAGVGGPTPFKPHCITTSTAPTVRSPAPGVRPKPRVWG